ncbi:uncharacterized protein F4822DRAFT_432212 [Hypoxylon trugodes]|uniref:uncharacterized protein n=1 Tax=Hypoxylon trugodes TaxID=326681 RepID=UPI002197B564|nr:uncharacterized protein F4822DRAFT_432212 [Hypoxylon trugodes]KAI1385362.1 hypothetical protein F4822DRAFT_432212 [Hypoxylon trugodes]
MDRDAFFNIVARPHLAGAVRELVWYELANDIPSWSTPSTPIEDDSDSSNYYEGLDEDADFYSELKLQILDLFWFSLQIAHSGEKPGMSIVDEMPKLDEFMTQF